MQLICTGGCAIYKLQRKWRTAFRCPDLYIEKRASQLALAFYSASPYAAGEHTGLLTAHDLACGGFLGDPFGTGSHWNTSTGWVYFVRSRPGLVRSVGGDDL
ncbi:hypothetical protein EVAR_92378_1 [Eumeta japonica]|uniref:Uncharacterized protein n=1 Tax=Eumeta variegata TaxID=151549 RepID=A0A4C1TJM1_EUMVA|nr:hypothetical protein EVAR_92378_1 [Eumeta japonica]